MLVTKQNKFVNHSICIVLIITGVLPGRMDDFSFSWMITFNGFIVDARTMPREIQEMTYEKGIIPYIHADKAINDG